jgi:hypothetical protein
MSKFSTYLFRQDDDKLETLLEKLEESRHADKGITLEERNMIMEDTEYLAALSNSDTLFKIFKLMSNAQERFKNDDEIIQPSGAARSPNDQHDVKMTYDLEFEKLLFMLKNQYQSFFESRKKQREQYIRNEDSVSLTESESEPEQDISGVQYERKISLVERLSQNPQHGRMQNLPQSRPVIQPQTIQVKPPVQDPVNTNPERKN